jgi:hypothetical protein
MNNFEEINKVTTLTAISFINELINLDEITQQKKDFENNIQIKYISEIILQS